MKTVVLYEVFSWFWCKYNTKGVRTVTWQYSIGFVWKTKITNTRKVLFHDGWKTVQFYDSHSLIKGKVDLFCMIVSISAFILDVL